MQPIKWRATIRQFVLNENSQGCEICLHYKNPKEFLSKLRKLKFSIKWIEIILIWNFGAHKEMHHRLFIFNYTWRLWPSSIQGFLLCYIIYFLFIYFVEDGLPHQNVYQYRINSMLMLQILQKHFLMRTQMNIVTWQNWPTVSSTHVHNDARVKALLLCVFKGVLTLLYWYYSIVFKINLYNLIYGP